ncbi:MAG: FHA domain-containing protein [Acidobacteriota bacterium]
MDRKLVANLPSGPKTFELVRPVHTIGRDPECDIPVDHASLSRKHAKVLVSEGSCLITDLGSRNGTFVNGSRIHGEAPLKDGDEVRCGNIAFSYQDGTGAAASASGEGFRAKKDGIVGVLSSDLEIAEKFKQSSKLLTYGLVLPTLNWKLRMFLFVFTMILIATSGLLFAVHNQAEVIEQKYMEGIVKSYALENVVVFDQKLPFYSYRSCYGEAAVAESYLLDAEGVPVFPPDKPKIKTASISNRPLEKIREYTRLPGPAGKLIGVAPIPPDGQATQGYAVVVWDPSKRQRSQFAEAGVVIGAVIVTVVGFLSIAVSSRIISKPIKNFEEEIELMTSGQLGEMSTYGGFPELNAVVKAVYLLIMRLRLRAD